MTTTELPPPISHPSRFFSRRTEPNRTKALPAASCQTDSFVKVTVNTGLQPANVFTLELGNREY